MSLTIWAARVHQSVPHEDSTELLTAMWLSRKLRLVFNLLCDLFVFDMKIQKSKGTIWKNATEIFFNASFQGCFT